MPSCRAHNFAPLSRTALCSGDVAHDGAVIGRADREAENVSWSGYNESMSATLGQPRLWPCYHPRIFSGKLRANGRPRSRDIFYRVTMADWLTRYSSEADHGQFRTWPMGNPRISRLVW